MKFCRWDDLRPASSVKNEGAQAWKRHCGGMGFGRIGALIIGKQTAIFSSHEMDSRVTKGAVN